MGIIIISLELWCMVMVWGVLECAVWSPETGDSPLCFPDNSKLQPNSCVYTDMYLVYSVYLHILYVYYTLCSERIICRATYKVFCVFVYIVYSVYLLFFLVYFVCSVFICIRGAMYCIVYIGYSLYLSSLCILYICVFCMYSLYNIVCRAIDL